jgi:hypothetical protein
MHSHFRVVLGTVGAIAALMIAILGFHLGGTGALKFGVYSPLLGAFTGGTLILVSTTIPFGWKEKAEPWLGREQIAWMLIGGGCIAWGIGECFWRYYVAHGDAPFPSLADFGYSSFAPLVFWGLLWQPSTKTSHRQIFLLLDSLIAMGALLSIGWFFLLGPLAQTPAESLLAKFLSLYYPTTDIALLSYITFLLLRGHDRIYLARARRISLIVIGVGLGIYAISDFFFNILQNMGQPVDGIWIDLGWPLGIMTMGIAAYLRRFLPSSTPASDQELQETETIRLRSGPAQAVPYLLLAVLFILLAFNVFSTDAVQQSIRPVLIVATLAVVSLVIIRQIVTIRENERLMVEQVATLKKLEMVYQGIEKSKTELEAGVTLLKEVQTRLANGDVRARASMMSGDLWPLANGLNLMADRMMRSEQQQRYAQKAIKALGDLNMALEQRDSKTRFVLPASCLDAPPEVQHLLVVMGLKATPGTPPLRR